MTESGQNPTDGITGGMHANHLRKATIERNVKRDLPQVPYHCPRPALRISNRDRDASSWYGSEFTPAPRQLVDVRGYRVHLYCTGTGSPTVVIVGAGFTFNWGLVQPEVAKLTQVCSYDHSGIGWSDEGTKLVGFRGDYKPIQGFRRMASTNALGNRTQQWTGTYVVATAALEILKSSRLASCPAAWAVQSTWDH
jgi:hypothetical protein